MRYSLVLISDKNEWQIINLKAGNKIVQKAYLEQIDYVTCGYQNVEEYLTDLSKQVEFKFAPVEVAIVYRDNKRWKKTPLIYNNPRLRAKALDSLQKKQRKQDSHMEVDGELIELREKLKAYALTENIYKYMSNTTRVFPYHIFQLLQAYKEADKLIGDDRREEMEEKSERILYHLRDYLNYRKILLWEQRYERYKNKNNLPEDNKDVQMKLVDFFENDEREVADIKELTLTEEEYKNAPTIHYTDGEISNPYIKNLYQKYDGDIEIITEIVGEDYMDNLTDEDQYLCGYSDYKKRGR